jgi:hypothetical protein
LILWESFWRLISCPLLAGNWIWFDMAIWADCLTLILVLWFMMGPFGMLTRIPWNELPPESW